MDIASRAENENTKQPEKSQKLLEQALQKQLAKREEVAEEVKKAIQQLQKEQEPSEKISRTGGKQTQQMVKDLKQERVEGSISKAPLPPDAYFPEVPPSLAYEAQSFCADAGGIPLPYLETWFLTQQYIQLKRRAGSLSSTFLSSIRNELLTRTVSIPVLDEVAQNLPVSPKEKLENEWRDHYKKKFGIDNIYNLPLEEQKIFRAVMKRGIHPMSGGAQQLSSDGIDDTPILDQITTANTLLGAAPDGDWQDQIGTLEKTLDRLAFLPTVNADQRRIIQTRIANRLVELKQQERGSDREERADHPEGTTGSRRGRGNERKIEPLQGGDVNRKDLDLALYSDPTLKPVVEEIRERIRTGQATEDYIRGKRVELGNLRNNPRTQDAEGNETEFGRQVKNLHFESSQLLDLIAARAREERSKDVSTWSSYGELRLLVEEKKELIDLALKAGGTIDPNAPNREALEAEKRRAERDIEKRFNELFASADVRTNDDWREAMGQAAAIEVDDFIRALTAVQSGKIAYNGELLTRDQREAVGSVVVKLTEEQKLREYLHSISFYVNQSANAEQIHKIMNSFKAEQADRAFRTPGVAVASHLYEQAMLQVMAKNGGYLPAKAMTNTLDGKRGEVEKITWDNMNTARDVGVLPSDMEDWELSRAISLARGMGIVTARTIEIVAASGIPKGAPLVSWYANDIIKNIAIFRQIARYDVGKERNRIAAFNLEDPSSAWSTTELESYTRAGALNRFANEGNDRFIDMINPMEVGSVFYQTGWRWGDDKVNHAGAIAHILDGDPTSTIIGVGLWIEKEKRNLKSSKKLNDKEKELYTGEFGQPIETEGQRAEANIRRNLELAAKITPLKLFYNLNGLRQEVLRSDTIKSLYGANAVREEEDAPGQILIREEKLEKDLSRLALVQEKLSRKRIDAYKAHLEGKRERPDLLSDEFTKLDFSGFGADGERVTQLAGLIKNTFMKDNHYERLMHNLRDKSWKVPFVFGADDVPYDIYNFAETGPTSFFRRWGDIESVANAASLYEKLIRNMASFHDVGSIVKALDEVYRTLTGHDEDVTRRFMTKAIEGISKYYKKDWQARMPGGWGTLHGRVSGKASYAQVAFGRDQMAWDELDSRDFLIMCHEAGLMNHDQMEELKKKTGAEQWNVILALMRTATPLSLFAFLYYLFSQELEDIKKTAV